MTGAEIAGIVLGAIGAMTGATALIYTRRTASIEAARHYDERRPRLRLAYSRDKPTWPKHSQLRAVSATPYIRITNLGPTPVDSLWISLAQHPPVVRGFDPEDVQSIAGDLIQILGVEYVNDGTVFSVRPDIPGGQLGLGDVVSVRVGETVRTPDGRKTSGGELILAVRVASYGQLWEIVLSCQVPDP